VGANLNGGKKDPQDGCKIKELTEYRELKDKGAGAGVLDFDHTGQLGKNKKPRKELKGVPAAKIQGVGDLEDLRSGKKV